MVTLPKSKMSLTALGVCLSLIALALAGISKFLGASVPAFSWLEFAAVSTSYVCTLLLVHPDGVQQVVHLWWYVVKFTEEDGYVWWRVLPKRVFEEMYEEI